MTIKEVKDKWKGIKLTTFCLFLFAGCHFGYLLFFLFIQVYPMAIFNVISVLIFTILGILNTKKRLNQSVINYIILAEFTTHQICSVFFVGLGCGFQYILFGTTISITTIYDKKKMKFNSCVNFIVACTTYCFLMFYFNDYTPIYVIDDIISKIICVYNIFLTFGTLKFCTEQIYSGYEYRHSTLQQNIIYSIAELVECRDEETGEHVKRTSELSRKIALELRKSNKYTNLLTDEYISNIESAAALHDIGKIKVPDYILTKPGKLTEEEYNIMKKHTTDGSQSVNNILSNIEDKEYTQIAYDISRYHHERIDGKGYPDNLSGDEIPIAAKIVTVADVFDALTSSRCYKEAFSKEKSIEILKEGIGTQFDGDIVYALLKVID